MIGCKCSVDGNVNTVFTGLPVPFKIQLVESILTFLKVPDIGVDCAACHADLIICLGRSIKDDLIVLSVTGSSDIKVGITAESIFGSKSKSSFQTIRNFHITGSFRTGMSSIDHKIAVSTVDNIICLISYRGFITHIECGLLAKGKSVCDSQICSIAAVENGAVNGK